MVSKTKRTDVDFPKTSTVLTLHTQAEEIVQGSVVPPRENQGVDDQLPAATRRILHELRVHQIELELQNEELRRTQVELEAARARYFDLYDLAPVGYCTVSEQGMILQANLTATTLLGVPRIAFVKQPISRFILKIDQDIFYLCRLQLIKTGEPQTCELRMVKHDSTQIWVRLSATVAQEDGGVPVLRMTLADVTESKLMVAAIRDSEARYRTLSKVLVEKNVELERAKLVAEQANLAKSNFLSSMTHELRSPLNAILGFAQLIESGTPKPTPSQKCSVDQILHAGWYLLELINEILDLALIEAGKLSLSSQPVSLYEVMLDCQALINPQAQKSGIRMSFPQVNNRSFVMGDRTRLKQIVINLLSNAIKYNKADGTVTVYYKASAPGRIRICVEDTGEGLTPDQLTQLFQLFNRLGQEAGSVEGTGLGLVVCKRLIELMGGIIGVESTAGKGSVFWIEMNLTAEPQPVAGATEPMVDAPLYTLPYADDQQAKMSWT